MFYFVQPVPPIGGRSTGRGRHGSMNPANGRERKRGGMRFSLALMPPESETEPRRRKAASGIARRVSHALRSPAEAAHTSAPAAAPHRRSSTPNAPAASPAPVMRKTITRSAHRGFNSPAPRCPRFSTPPARAPLPGRGSGQVLSTHDPVLGCFNSPGSSRPPFRPLRLAHHFQVEDRAKFCQLSLDPRQ